jgi:putative DNA primase/helicase
MIGIRTAASITMKPVQWLWKDWIALGKLHLLAGSPGTGKTTLALTIAAAITNGTPFPDGQTAPAGDVLIWSGEDSVEDTLTPRLYAAGANCDRFHFIQASVSPDRRRVFNPATDRIHVEEMLKNATDISRPKLIILDPIVSATDGLTNSAVRASLEPWVRMAEKYNVAIIGITHVAKGTRGKTPLERVLGAQAFVALSRVVLMADKRSNGETVLVRVKSNIGDCDGGFIYSVLDTEFPSPKDHSVKIKSSFVSWGDYIDASASEILKGDHDNDEPSRLDDAVRLIRSILAGGPVLTDSIRQRGLAEGHSWATLRRAKDELQVESVRMGRSWGWQLCPTN